jgi:cytidylate kinase
MAKRNIICISREFGSGGAKVGALLAQRLGIPCYDKELVYQAAVEQSLLPEQLESVDEKPISWTSMGFPHGIRNPYHTDFDALYYTLNDRVFSVQAQIIRKFAEAGSCVIIGRVADDVLKGDPDLISIFIHAQPEYKVRRVMARDNCSARDAADRIRKVDRERAKYYNFYAQKPWGQCASYDLSLATSTFSIEGAAQVILEALVWRESIQKTTPQE